MFRSYDCLKTFKSFIVFKQWNLIFLTKSSQNEKNILKGLNEFSLHDPNISLIQEFNPDWQAKCDEIHNSRQYPTHSY